MKLVLGAGVKPRVGLEGPRVRLFVGNYRFVVENCKDSIVVLHNKHGKLAKDDFVSTSEVFWYVFDKVGTEDYINIFAELINGAHAPKPT